MENIKKWSLKMCLWIDIPYSWLCFISLDFSRQVYLKLVFWLYHSKHQKLDWCELTSEPITNGWLLSPQGQAPNPCTWSLSQKMSIAQWAIFLSQCLPLHSISGHNCASYGAQNKELEFWSRRSVFESQLCHLLWGN
jgi:hypothetical protein